MASTCDAGDWHVCVLTPDRYYDLYGRTYLFSVDFHHLKFDMQNPDDWDNAYVVDAYHAGNVSVRRSNEV